MLRYSNFFRFSNTAAAAILDWLGGYLDQSRIVIGGLYRYATFGWNRCSIFDNMEVLIFCTFGLKTLIQAPKIGVFGRYDSLNGVRYQRNPQKAHPWAERRRTTHRSLKSVYRCDLLACPRNQKRKKDKERNSTVANWIFAETTHVVGSKRRLAWWVVLGRFLTFIQIGSLVSELWGWQIAHSHCIAQWLIQQFVLPYKP